MMDRQHGNILFECDNCGDTLATGELDWAEAKAVFDADGWKAKKEDDVWVHYCPSCRGDGGFRHER